MPSLLADVRLRLGASEPTRVLLLGALVGALGGAAAGALDRLMVWTGQLALGTADPSVVEHAVGRALLAPTLTAALAGALLYYASRAGQPQGVSEVIEEIAEGRRVHAKEGVLSALAAVLTVGGGQSAGREGPIVQLAATAASETCHRLAIPKRTARVLVAAGAAAGIAASFNTPLGGAFFAMEVLLGSFALEAFAPVVVATVVGTVVGQALFGERLALTLPPFHLSSPLELLVYPVLGVVCGVVAIGFRRLIALMRSQIEGMPYHPVLWVTSSGLVVGVLAALGLPQVMGNGYRFIEELIQGEFTSVGVLLAILLAKLLLSAWASVVRSGAGLFAPSLFLGASTGVLVGWVAHGLAPTVVADPGALGVVGMGAVAAALAHNPITMTLMLFEMTGHYTVVLPLLITVAVANLVAKTADEASIYIQVLLDRGVDLSRGREEQVLRDLKVRDVMRAEESYPLILADAPFCELAELFLSRREDEIFVVDREGRLVGVVDIQDVKGNLTECSNEDGRAVREISRDTPQLGPRDSVAEVLAHFYRSEQEALPVVNSEGVLVGVLVERDVVGALDREVLRQDALMARFQHGPVEDRHTDFFELPEGHGVGTVPVDDALDGLSIKQLNLTHRFGLTVLAVDVWESVEQRHHRRPVEAELAVHEGDRLVLMGPVAQLRALSDASDEVEVTMEVTRELAAPGAQLGEE